MSVVAIGLNHRTVPLELLERMTISGARLPKALHDLRARTHLSEAVVLSTCNRTEVYAVAERVHGAYADIRDALGEISHVAPEDFSDHLYVHYDHDAVRHLFSVASGLDSAVLGESEILGQVKGAWELAQAESSAGSMLNLLFRHAVETGKRARTETTISHHTTSISQAAVAMAVDRLGRLTGARVLVLGAGEMGEGMATSLLGAGAAEVLVANRTWARAVEVADRVGGRAVRLGDLRVALGSVDVLLTSTGASSLMVEHGDLDAAMQGRADRPMLIVDIAVPRDVDPSSADIPGVTLLDMDDLRRFTEVGLRGRQREVSGVRRIVDEELQRFLGLRSAREAAPLVADLRTRADEIRQLELDRYRARLDHLDERDRETIEALTRGMLAKLLHEPTVRLKDAAGTPRGDRLADALRDLFDL
ncbi:MAG TPA: glutamyl-tRNA reductase [Acidimicrobiales bacterium]|nr:glutamyl-tRNA reductase [Acidimicrobiales bacterium]